MAAVVQQDLIPAHNGSRRRVMSAKQLYKLVRKKHIPGREYPIRVNAGRAASQVIEANLEMMHRCAARLARHGVQPRRYRQKTEELVAFVAGRPSPHPTQGCPI